MDLVDDFMKWLGDLFDCCGFEDEDDFEETWYKDDEQREHGEELAQICLIFAAFGKMSGMKEFKELASGTKSVLKNYMDKCGFDRRKKSLASVAFAGHSREHDDDTLLDLLREKVSFDTDIDPESIARTCMALYCSEKNNPGGHQYFRKLCDALELDEVARDEIIRHSDIHKIQCEKSIFGTGSGFIASPDGFIVTCAHVVEDTLKVFVKFKNHFLEARIVAFDRDHDVALLKVEVEQPYEKLPFLRIGDEIPDIGTEILTYGYPLASIFGYDLNATSGVIQKKTGEKDEPGFITIDCKILQGNSGGPVIGKSTNTVVGMSAKAEPIPDPFLNECVDNRFNMAVNCEKIGGFLEGCYEWKAPDADVPGCGKAEDAVVQVFCRNEREDERDIVDVLAFADESERNKLSHLTKPGYGSEPHVLCDHMDWLHAQILPRHKGDTRIPYKRILTSVADKIGVPWSSVDKEWKDMKLVDVEKLIVKRLFEDENFKHLKPDDHPALAERILEEWEDRHDSYWKRLAAGVVYIYHIGHYIEDSEGRSS